MHSLYQTMRWYGPKDPVSLSNILQAGAQGVVTSLHQIETGQIWSIEDILQRKKMIESAGLTWTVVESLPVHENIKTKTKNYKKLIENYKRSIENLGKCGIHIVCYNFMPVLDWVRTDLSFELEDGSKALKFEIVDIAIFDIFILKREGAVSDYSPKVANEATSRYHQLKQNNPKEIERLMNTILLGFPGSEEQQTLKELRDKIENYRCIDKKVLADNLNTFLREVIPAAEKSNVSLAIHPDDPPFPVFGLPRVVSTSNDFERILSNTKSIRNGITFCTGSLAARKDNDLIQIIKKYAQFIHFLHLRNIKRDKEGNFYESGHLSGSVSMKDMMQELLILQKRKNITIPIRPDHGHQILDDLDKQTYPGYTAIGRLKGLAELRGLALGLQNT
ncbi:mannonate dehydratase [Aquimarina sp. U1-2]|uniref:mannonate dehydratase n=1 Tax=Aquimarina sp. U1-2 TaxID=2823141 RepID=UPI001AECA544|nr:mannonate dehydratase [Aquimarina sp. U1-2]MBP2832906.1 mannonate dehydratase [Aquimarina sp. U1-2]